MANTASVPQASVPAAGDAADLQPPFSTEAEQSLLGGLMLGTRQGSDIADRLIFLRAKALLTTQDTPLGDAIGFTSLEASQWPGMEVRS